MDKANDSKMKRALLIGQAGSSLSESFWLSFLVFKYYTLSPKHIKGDTPCITRSIRTKFVPPSVEGLI